jgi:hypothetical protein
MRRLRDAIDYTTKDKRPLGPEIFLAHALQLRGVEVREMPVRFGLLKPSGHVQHIRRRAGRRRRRGRRRQRAIFTTPEPGPPP